MSQISIEPRSLFSRLRRGNLMAWRNDRSFACKGKPILVSFAGCVEFFVSAIKDHLLLLLAFFSIVGCSSTERFRYQPLSTSPNSSRMSYAPGAISSSTALPASFTPAIPNRAEVAPVRQIEPQAAREAIPSHVLKHFERKPDLPENSEQTSPSPVPQPAPRSAGGPSADHRLLEILEKDLNKAVEQPRERRRLQFSKEAIENPKVRHFIKHYSTTVKDQFQVLLARSGKYMPMISKVLYEEGLPEELGYLALVESEFNVGATSPIGAVGLWQFVPATARQYGLRIDNWVDERRDPIKSTRAAVAYLKELHSYYGRWFLVTAAYNAGPGVINKALEISRAKDFWGIKGKNQLREETRNFVPKFIATALIATDPKKYGFNDIAYLEPLEFDEVEAEGLLKIDALAEMAQSEAVTIKELNPHLLRRMTPPGEKGYSIRVPVGKSAIFAKANDDLKGKERDIGKAVTHVVKRGDTLASIARYYGQAVTTLMKINGLTTPRVKIGQRIQVFFEGVRATLR
jgi:LysM repeat protein